MIKLMAGTALLMTLVSTAVFAVPPQPDFARGDDGKLVEQTPYPFPESHEAWLADASAINLERANLLGSLYEKSLFDRCSSGQAAEAHQITYMSEGLQIKGYLVKPISVEEDLPVIIFNHGGVMQWGNIYFFEILEMCRIAERGYVLLASHFRGEGGSEGEPEMGGGDVTDALNLIALARRLPGADAARIGLWGFSRGGGVTYRALARTDAIAAAVTIGGQADALTSHRRAEFDEFVYPHVLRDYEADKDAALLRISPVKWVHKLSATTPILMLHGGADWRVLPGTSLRMATELQDLQRPYRLKIYEGGSHSLMENYGDVRRELDRWFDLYLRDGVPPPKNEPVKPPELD